jgi:Acyl-protein synthetase, LuxE
VLFAFIHGALSTQRQTRLQQNEFTLQYPSAVAENQPANKNRMTTELSNFAARLRGRIPSFSDVAAEVTRLQTFPILKNEPPHVGCYENEFNVLALELFALQFKHNAAYRKICAARRLTPKVVEHWTQIPAAPTAVFKELDLTCLAPAERTAVFYSSGTTEQRPSRHFHNLESLKVYEASLWQWFRSHLFADKLKLELQPAVAPAGVQASACDGGAEDFGFVILTPPPAQAPHSSLVHMFETIRQKLGAAETAFVGKLAADGSWTLDFSAVVEAFSPRRQIPDARPQLLLGTAFSFVHLLDYLAEKHLRFDLPAGSRVMETGGYKNRSRSMPKAELHQLITERLGVPPSHIICEYGMSELSSQAYDLGALASRRRVFPGATKELAGETPALPGFVTRHFRFPSWARVQIISPETRSEVAGGETGLIRVFDLANVFSVMAIQTEDLGIRRGGGFELIGHAQLAEPRGCSLMSHSAFRNPQSAIQ